MLVKCSTTFLMLLCILLIYYLCYLCYYVIVTMNACCKLYVNVLVKNVYTR
jgi:hypothetical protein